MNTYPSPSEHDGTIQAMGGGRLFLHRVLNPFVFSVECLPRPDGTFICEWWVTGPTNPQLGSAPPVLLIHFVMGIGCKKEDLENEINMWWEQRIEELAFASAISGGIVVDSKRLKELPAATQHDIIHNHLASHDRLQHFAPAKGSRATLTIRTAFMYGLLRSLGVSKVQKEIANFESLNFPEFWDEVKGGEDITVTPEVINQRLTHAKKLLILENLTPKRGRRPNASTQMREASLPNEDFASRNNQLTREGDAKE
jgi:hypothetical protein